MDKFDEVRKLIRKIEDATKDGDDIFRGEPKDFGKVSSGFFRKHIMETDLEFLCVDNGSIDTLSIWFADKAFLWGRDQEFTEHHPGKPDEIDRRPIISEMQHHGGITNEIDFTSDFLVALFFACDDSDYNDQDGRLILLSQACAKKMGVVWKPDGPPERVIAQKSIFVRPRNGYIDPKDVSKIIRIPKNLKGPILEYLAKVHGITPEYIYSGVLGFIRRPELYKKEVKERLLYDAIPHYDRVKDDYLMGMAYVELGKFGTAILHLSRSINHKPTAEAHCNRAIARIKKLQLPPLSEADWHNLTKDEYSELEDARDDLREAIKIFPLWIDAYLWLAICYGHMGQVKKMGECISRANKTREYNPPDLKRVPRWLERTVEKSKSWKTKIAED